jgi:hypothetical protein
MPEWLPPGTLPPLYAGWIGELLYCHPEVMVAALL